MIHCARNDFLVEAFVTSVFRTKQQAIGRCLNNHPTIKLGSHEEVLSDKKWRQKPQGLAMAAFWRRDAEEPLNDPECPDLFDLIVVGSGNGACAFLQQCLEHSNKPVLKVLVLEQGEKYFYTSDITHQNGWSKSYSTDSIFRLHNAVTPSGIPVLSGKACTMGGGGSINYTMIYESSQWLAKNIGHTVEFWDKLKEELSVLFDRPDPFAIETPFCKYIQEQAVTVGNYAKATEKHMTANIPSYQDQLRRQLYAFPTQFNEHGQRTHSGVSLVDWRDSRLTLRVNREVRELLFDESGDNGDSSTCVGVKVKNNKTGDIEEYKLLDGTGKLILCGGSASPRLLMRSREHFNGNTNIGKHVSDHICMPLALFSIRDDMKGTIGPKDIYETTFAMSTLETVGDPVVINIDFFTGTLDRMSYLASSLYLAYLPFNGFKKFLGRNPRAFTVLSNAIRVLLSVIIFVSQVLFALWDIIRFQPIGSTEPKLTTSLVKFNPTKEGYYEDGNRDQITLGFFEDERDNAIAETAIKENLKFLQSLGLEPWGPFKWIFRFITRIPYKEDQVSRYVEHFAARTLLSEQHLAGGCVFGKVVDPGTRNPLETGKVFGSTNIHVADLSTVPLPRVSTQMTAYLIGHYVGHQLFATTGGRNK
ncbi:hypothetical protein ACA910_016366 [Epithemia clementina (nom. ined.)]